MVMPLVTLSLLPWSLHVRESKGIHDSLGFWIQCHGFLIPGTEFQFLSVELGFWIPIVSGMLDSLFCIPESKPRIPDSTRQKFHGFRNPDSPFPWAVHGGDVKVLIRSCHHLPAEESYDEARRLLRRKYGDEFRIATTTSFICMTIQAHTVLQKLFFGIKITS